MDFLKSIERDTFSRKEFQQVYTIIYKPGVLFIVWLVGMVTKMFPTSCNEKTLNPPQLMTSPVL